LARDAVAHQQYPEAITQLTWVIDHASDSALRQIAKIRMARILITENKSRDALSELQKVYNHNFNGLIEEVKGDAYIQLKDNANAKTAYQLALNELPKDEAAEKPLLQMKLDNLASQ
jgi:predicted negative regulator of RcsB-dependent stress response